MDTITCVNTHGGIGQERVESTQPSTNPVLKCSRQADMHGYPGGSQLPRQIWPVPLPREARLQSIAAGRPHSSARRARATSIIIRLFYVTSRTDSRKASATNLISSASCVYEACAVVTRSARELPDIRTMCSMDDERRELRRHAPIP